MHCLSASERTVGLSERGALVPIGENTYSSMVVCIVDQGEPIVR